MATFAEYFKQRGLKEGWQEGRQKGRQEGLQEGVQRGEYSLLIRLLERKFKKISLHVLQQLAQANAETLLIIGERVLEAKKLEDIF